MNGAEKQRAAAAAASAVGARTARACDGCLRRRARWFCAADDAFLCQACDASVHSANPLARRHHRLRLKTASSSSSAAAAPPPAWPALDADEPPAWLHGFRRKARTPRGKPSYVVKAETTVVPDLEAEEKDEEAEEQLLYRVPIFDPVLAEFCPPPPPKEVEPAAQPIDPFESASAAAVASSDGLVGFRNVSDLDVAEFAADMESLLGGGPEDDSFTLYELGLMDSEVKEEMDADPAAAAGEMGVEIEICREPMDVKFDRGAAPAAEEEEAVKAAAPVSSVSEGEATVAAKRKMILRLDYQAVMAEWSCKGCSPWTGGERPQLDPDDCWPEFADTWGGGGAAAAAGHRDPAAAAVDGGREARVTRYREKRRTRLFAKKIRYEVRKLNAEKRPRMKGRFVKRAAFPAAAAAAPAIPRGAFPF